MWRAVYKIERNNIHQAILNLLGLSNAVIEQLEEVKAALSYYQQGMDFADALHLAASPQAEELQTFDKAFIKIANQLNTQPVVTRPESQIPTDDTDSADSFLLASAVGEEFERF